MCNSEQLKVNLKQTQCKRTSRMPHCVQFLSADGVLPPEYFWDPGVYMLH
jgi:hypothetical protein